MTIFTDGLRLEPENRGITDYATSFGQSLGATVSETLSDSPTAQMLGIGELEQAKGSDLSRMQGIDGIETFGGGDPAPTPAVPTIGKLEAAERVKAAGLAADLKLPDQDIAVPALDIMINRARDRREREATIQRGPQNVLMTATSIGTSFLVGAVDPLNIASAFIPVMGELRYGKLLASVGEGLAGRTAVRAGVGAASGAVGQAALEPLDWYAHTQDGRDFGMSDVLHNLVFGAALGGGMHAAGGGIRDVYRSRKGLAQYPFGPGEPMEHVEGTHLPASVLTPEGIAAEDLVGHLRPVVDRIDQVLSESPAMRVLQDLPPRAHEDSMRAAIAAIVDGEPVKVGELLHAAARTDPRIAESFEAWHGSPHLFERFDADHIGAGEGKQSYGHGLYFAERRDVARSYGDNLDRDVGYSDYADEAHYWLGQADRDKKVAARLYSENAKAHGVEPDSAVLEYFKPGNLYKVQIKAEKAHFLDWEGSFDAQHPHVQAGLRSLGFSEVEHAGMPGGSLIQELGARDEAGTSKRLSEVGIPGITYLDRKWKGSGEHTRNFVVFDDKHIDILDRNGKPVAQRELPARLHSLSAEARNWPQPPEGAHIVAQGDHGPELAGLEGRWREAVDWLSQAQSGDARGVLHHPDVPGPIDVIWGTKAFGLEHIMAKHPEMVPDLPDRLARMRVVDKHSDRIQLESPDGQERAAIALTFHGDQKIWLLTAFDRRAGDGGEPPPPGGPGDRPGLRPATDLQPSPSRYYGGEGAGPESKLGRIDQSGNPKIVLGADRDLVTVPKPRGRAAPHPDSWSLNEHLASKGGLRPDPELEAIFGSSRGPFVPGFGPLVRKSGMTLDDALSSAKQHGYMLDPHDIENGTAGAGGRTSHGLTPNDLLDHLDNENRGQRLYKPGHVEQTKFDPDQEKHVIMGALETELERSGADVSAIDPKLLDRTVEIVHRERESDVLVAYERAIMEDSERYESIAHARDLETNHPARDVPFDAGPASGRGGPDPVDGGPAGRAGPGERRADGGQPSYAGAGDQSARDAAWRELASTQPDVTDAGLLEVSRAADSLPEPVKTKLDDRVAAAENADAFAKQMYDMFADRLPPEERQRLDDLIKSIDDDAATRKDAIERSGACLFGARS